MIAMMLKQCVRRLSTVKRPAAGEPADIWKMLKEEAGVLRTGKITTSELETPRETDVLIVGGGIMGNSAAFWLKQRNPNGISVTVVERDPCLTRASTMLSAGGLRHQFTLPESVQMSMFATEFLKNIREYLTVLDMDPPDIQFNHHGYMFLVQEEHVESLQKNIDMQRELGVKVEMYTKDRLSKKFPWLNLDGIAAGSYGLEGEGWFDPWLLTKALKQKNVSLGVKYMTGEVNGFEYKEEHVPIGSTHTEIHHLLKAANVKLRDGSIQPINFCFMVNCAGAWAAEVASLAGIGQGPGELSVGLPVEPRKRFVYVVHCPNGPGLSSPFLIDPSGVYVRREGLGGSYICGCSPLPWENEVMCEENEPDIEALDVDYEFFNEVVWPKLAERIPKFECLKLRSAWAGYYDYNAFDQNAIIGNHPRHKNFFFMNGFSGHGVQHAIAAGRGIMEMTIDDDFKTIDLSRFTFDRVIANQPLLEGAIV